MEKMKDSEVKHAILDHLHMVMFMSINPKETINDFKAHGREMVVENFDNLQPSKRSPFQVWHVLKPFFVMYALQVACSFFTHV
jgi:hypothetical protein